MEEASSTCIPPHGAWSFCSLRVTLKVLFLTGHRGCHPRPCAPPLPSVALGTASQGQNEIEGKGPTLGSIQRKGLGTHRQGGGGDGDWGAMGRMEGKELGAS